MLKMSFKFGRTSQNVLTLVVEWVLWYSICSKNKNTHIHTHRHTHTFLPGTVKDIYSDYVGPWRSKIAVIRKLARHLSLQQPIKWLVPPAANVKKIYTKMIPTGPWVCVCVLLCLVFPFLGGGGEFSFLKWKRLVFLLGGVTQYDKCEL